MYIINEKGRSMIEMLGVLAIVGVLTVGSLGIIGKTRQQYTITQILSETTTLISNARKMTCDYDSDYGSYTNMLYRSDAYPEGVSVEMSQDETPTAFVLAGDAKLAIDAANTNNSAFKVTLSNIPSEACVAIITSDWNTKGLISATTSTSDEETISDTSPTDEETTKVVDLDTAASACNGANPKLILTFSGCLRADHD